ERPHNARNTDTGAEIGAARDHRLHGLAGARRAESLERKVVLLEERVAQRWRLVFPVVDLPDRDLEAVLRLRRGQRERQSDSNRTSEPHQVISSHGIGLLKLKRAAPCRAPSNALSPTIVRLSALERYAGEGALRDQAASTSVPRCAPPHWAWH